MRFAIFASFALAWTTASRTPEAASQSKTSGSKGTESTAEAPRVGGKTLEQWSKEFSAKDPSRREAAIRAVLGFPPKVGVKAIPGLLAEYKRSIPASPTDFSVRANLCIVLSELFASGETIDPKLEAETAVLLIRQLRDPEAILRLRAAQALASLGPEAKGAIPDLLNLIRERSSYEIRQAAANTLGAIAYDKKAGPHLPSLQALYKALDDPAFQVRLAAIRSLSILGPPGDPSQTPGYVKALEPTATKDPEPALQIWARVAIIGAKGEFGDDMLGPIAEFTKNGDAVVRAQAIQALGSIGPKAKSKVGAIANCLGDAEPSVKTVAVWALGRMEAAAIPHLPALERIAADPKSEEGLKKLVKDTIEKIKGN